jgi:hypothetical protein
MPLVYRHVLDDRAVEAAFALPTRARRRIRERLAGIAASRGLVDAVNIGRFDGREHWCGEEAGVVITFWIDHAVAEVRVVLIEQVE